LFHSPDHDEVNRKAKQLKPGRYAVQCPAPWPENVELISPALSDRLLLPNAESGPLSPPIVKPERLSRRVGSVDEHGALAQSERAQPAEAGVEHRAADAVAPTGRGNRTDIPEALNRQRYPVSY
jgi:hypothetical protein